MATILSRVMKHAPKRMSKAKYLTVRIVWWALYDVPLDFTHQEAVAVVGYGLTPADIHYSRRLNKHRS